MARDEKKYLIYALWSPSGKGYVGLTGQGVEKRWSCHVTRAMRAKDGSAHPLIAAIRKYGPENFRIEVIQEGFTKEDAGYAEQDWIAVLGTQHPSGYNISAGGENDSQKAVERFRELMADPVWKAGYIAKLKAALVGRGPRPDLQEAAARWRAENPRAAWAIAYRASRIALRGARKPAADPRFGPWGRLVIDSRKVAAARRGYFAKSIVAEVWAQRDDATRDALGKKIGRSLAKYHAENPDRIKATLVETRKNIDRKHQGARASAGLKGWWAELRKDPDRYAAYIQSRIDTKRERRARKDI